MTTSWQDAARLARRTGFGATGAQVDAIVRSGLERHVSTILAADPNADPGAKATPLPRLALVQPPATKVKTDPARVQYKKQLQTERQQLIGWWLRRMITVHEPFGEKLTFGWHNHFSTSLQKVRQPAAMAAQNEKLRTLGRGDFRTLGYAMLTDAAMLKWLDGQKNTATSPNENLSREFMELFALGHEDGYTEDDVRAGACALTGWHLDKNTGRAVYRPQRHDPRTVTFLGATGVFDTAQYLDRVLMVKGHPAFLVTRWWGQLASNSPAPAAAVQRAAAAYGPRRNLTAMFTSVLTAPEFTSTTGTIVTSPVEWLVGAARALKVPVTKDADVRKLGGVLKQLGQVPFAPPSVGGWPAGRAWLSTASAELRSQAAHAMTRHADLSALEGRAPSRVDAVAHLLGVPTWSDKTLTVLRAHAANPHDLVAVALNTPEYLVN